jgi:glycerate dehydrogenase
MKILILDGYTLFQSDLSWDVYASFGEVIYRDRTSREEIKDLPSDVDVIVTNKCLIRAEELSHFTNVKLILVAATGYNCVDVQACRERKIQVSNVPNYGTFSVAQHALSLLLHYSNQVGLHANSVAAGDWSQNADWCYTRHPIQEWHGKTVGIIGMGNIGNCFAGMAESLGMKVIYSHTKDLNFPYRRFVSIADLAQQSDVISLHCPLNPTTENLINTDFLAKMKTSAVLINTSRGGLIDNHALAHALENEVISAALLDVLDVEPPSESHILPITRNAFITPHIAWISLEARKRIVKSMRETLNMFIQGTAQNQVN